MSETIYMHGSEDVRTAAHEMRRAADEMQRAAATIDHAMERQRQFMDEWLARFESAMEGAPKK